MITIDKLRTQVKAITRLPFKQPIKQPKELPKLSNVQQSQVAISNYPKLFTVQYDAQGDKELTQKREGVAS